jgi:hypothetical protein
MQVKESQTSKPEIRKKFHVDGPVLKCGAGEGWRRSVRSIM